MKLDNDDDSFNCGQTELHKLWCKETIVNTVNSYYYHMQGCSYNNLGKFNYVLIDLL